MHEPLIVLKFGGSVLANEGTLSLVVHEIQRWRREGHAVVAVVSAMAGVTDALLARTRESCASPSPRAVAALVAGGELQCAALLGLALDAAGLPARVLNPAVLGLVAEGDPLDASPVALNAGRVRLALRDGQVVIVPGFVAHARDGSTVLLGRGGSDLTALLLAARLGAERCRLVKDVDGLYESDPALSGPAPRRYATASWDDALATDGRIIQRKALLFAQAHRLPFELGSWNSCSPTRIGAVGRAGVAGSPGGDGAADRDSLSLAGDFGADRVDADSPHRGAGRQVPLRIALLGLGTVGGAVWEQLRDLEGTFEVISAAVRDPERKRAAALPQDVLTGDVLEAAACGADIVVEALGGIEPARTAIEAALRAGSDVVSANKAVLAAHGAELLALARACSCTLRWSASVGGSTPVLAAVARAARGGTLLRVDAVLNGTTNFLLDQVAAGAAWPHALGAARRAGLAERDADRDLSGADAADKLVLLHHVATGRWIRTQDVRCTPVTPHSVAAASRPGTIVRQVATLTRRDKVWSASVALRALPPRHPLHDVLREGNAAVIRTRAGCTIVRGKGAGGRPTATAVVGDLLEIGAAREHRRRHRVDVMHIRTAGRFSVVRDTGPNPNSRAARDGRGRSIPGPPVTTCARS